jgi:hypothetical protein
MIRSAPPDPSMAPHSSSSTTPIRMALTGTAQRTAARCGVAAIDGRAGRYIARKPRRTNP